MLSHVETVGPKYCRDRSSIQHSSRGLLDAVILYFPRRSVPFEARTQSRPLFPFLGFRFPDNPL